MSATRKAVPPAKWIWLPHPGHLCVAFDCNFRMATVVGKYLVSTIGEYYPPPARDTKKPTEIGYGRLYETMVFEAGKDHSDCCGFGQASGSELEMEPYNTALDARAGHLAMCRKWAKKA